MIIKYILSSGMQCSISISVIYYKHNSIKHNSIQHISQAMDTTNQTQGYFSNIIDFNQRINYKLSQSKCQHKSDNNHSTREIWGLNILCFKEVSKFNPEIICIRLSQKSLDTKLNNKTQLLRKKHLAISAVALERRKPKTEALRKYRKHDFGPSIQRSNKQMPHLVTEKQDESKENRNSVVSMVW